ncbi:MULTISPECIES: ABC transporter permease [unclassified Devosia]|uniref:ABC transporter permease n=1 Tax=unclassified Devosia TaxID=196773 RepID=UPI00145D014B|nr:MULTISPECIES: ABC transporter permease [unclassified Devosia]MBJ6986181.1 ABC transporter permease [Devosia sp. MC521]QMW64332.1 ABC transporter permease [Devosia sp. MC521]
MTDAVSNTSGKLAITPAKPPFTRRIMPWLLLSPVMTVMLGAFVMPLLTFFQYSFYRFERGRLIEDFSFDTYIEFFTDSYYHMVILDTLKMASVTTFVSIVIGYPLAYALWRMQKPWMQKWFAVIIFSPILVSVVVRTYGWTVLLADQGPINWFLQQILQFPEPVRLVFNLTGVVISLTHVFLPFVVFPIFSVMQRIDPNLREAAMDLGAGWWTTFRRVTFPLTLPGLVSGAQIAFTLALGAFVTPQILGGGRILILPLQVYTATTEINWPLAAVGGIALLGLAMITVMISNRLLRFSEV